MTTITSVITLVVAILQIFLFFKIWGMTNNIKKIKENMIFDTQNNEVAKYVLLGQKDKAKEILIDTFFRRLSVEGYPYLKDWLKKELENIGEELPKQVEQANSKRELFELL